MAVLVSAVLLTDTQRLELGLSHKSSADCLLLYLWLRGRYVLLGFRIFALVHLALALFEFPASISGIPTWVLALVEGICLASYAVLLGLYARCDGFTATFRRCGWNLLVIACICLDLADLVLRVCEVTRLGWFRWVRPVFLIWQYDILRLASRNVVVAAVGIFPILILQWLIIAVYAVFCTNLFYGTNEGPIQFPNVAEGMWGLFILMTAVNSPDFGLPAYDESEWYGFVFWVYWILTTLFILNVTASQVYRIYRSQISRFTARKRRADGLALATAYRLLSTVVCSESTADASAASSLSAASSAAPPPAPPVSAQGLLAKPAVLLLLRILKPSYNDLELECAWSLLVSHAHAEALEGSWASPPRVLLPAPQEPSFSHLRIDQFASLVWLLSLRIRTAERSQPVLAQWFPRIYDSAPSMALVRMVKSRYFQWSVYATILGTFIYLLITIELALNGHDSSHAFLDYTFLGLFALQVLLCIYAYGLRRYAFSELGQAFDVILFLVLLVIVPVGLGVGPATNQQRALRVVLLLRSFRAFSLLTVFPAYRRLFSAIRAITKTVISYATIWFCALYVFIILGMNAFYNVLVPSNPLLTGTPYAEAGYYQLNFQSFVRGFGVAITLCIVNNWNVFALSIETAMQRPLWIRFYFVGFYTVMVMILMSIVLSVCIEVIYFQQTVSTTRLGGFDGGLNVSHDAAAVPAASPYSPDRAHCYVTPKTTAAQWHNIWPQDLISSTGPQSRMSLPFDVIGVAGNHFAVPAAVTIPSAPPAPPVAAAPAAPAEETRPSASPSEMEHIESHLELPFAVGAELADISLGSSMISSVVAQAENGNNRHSEMGLSHNA